MIKMNPWFILSTVFLSGCTSTMEFEFDKEDFMRDSYSVLKPDRLECQGIPESQYKECIEAVRAYPDYETYKKAREGSVKNKE